MFWGFDTMFEYVNIGEGKWEENRQGIVGITVVVDNQDLQSDDGMFAGNSVVG